MSNIIDSLSEKFSHLTEPSAVKAARKVCENVETDINPYGSEALGEFETELERHPESASQVAAVFSDALEKATNYRGAAFGILNVVADHPEISSKISPKVFADLGEKIANYSGRDTQYNRRYKCFDDFLDSINKINRGDVFAAIPIETIKKGAKTLDGKNPTDLVGWTDRWGWKALLAQPQWKAAVTPEIEAQLIKTAFANSAEPNQDLKEFSKLPNGKNLLSAITVDPIRPKLSSNPTTALLAIKQLRPDLETALTPADIRTAIETVKTKSTNLYADAPFLLSLITDTPAWKKALTPGDVYFFVNKVKEPKPVPNIAYTPEWDDTRPMMANYYLKLRDSVESDPALKKIVDDEMNAQGLDAQHVGSSDDIVIYDRKESAPQFFNFHRAPMTPNQATLDNAVGKKELTDSFSEMASGTQAPSWAKDEAKEGLKELGVSPAPAGKAPRR